MNNVSSVGLLGSLTAGKVFNGKFLSFKKSRHAGNSKEGNCPYLELGVSVMV